MDEALDGLTFIHPGLRRLAGHRVIVREQVSFNLLVDRLVYFWLKDNISVICFSNGVLP